MPTLESLYEKSEAASAKLDAAIDEVYPVGTELLLAWNSRGASFKATVYVGSRNGCLRVKAESGRIHRKHFRDVISILKRAEKVNVKEKVG